MTQMTASRGTRRSRLGAHYWRLWWASAISSTGDGAFVAALPLLAVTISRDPRLVAVVTAASYLPWMLLSLPAGALVDRYDVLSPALLLPDARVICVSGCDDGWLIDEMLRAGAVACFRKGVDRRELELAIRRVTRPERLAS